MDVRVTSTGRVFYQVDNAVAAMLMEAFPASFERAEAKPAPPATLVTTWGINHTTSNFHYVTFKIGSRTEIYDGPPSRLVSYFQQMGIVVPEHIAAQYAPLWQPRENAHQSEWQEFEALQGK
jgi:hypothetical protein